MTIDSSNTIHPTVIIHPNAKIGLNNSIGAYTVIEEFVEIGNNNTIGPLCYIGGVAEDVKFGYSRAKGVKIGNNVMLTGKVTIDSGTENDTIICNNVVVLKNGHIGHDAYIENNCSIRVNAIIGGHVKLGENTIVGLATIIQPRINVPKGAMLGAMTNVTKKSDLKANWVHFGNPCKSIRPRD